jgi:hypothetical protein
MDRDLIKASVRGRKNKFSEEERADRARKEEEVVRGRKVYFTIR